MAENVGGPKTYRIDMSKRATSARCVPVYSVQASSYAPGDPGRVIEHLSVADAAEEVLGERARWLRGGTAIQLLDLARAERLPMPSTITAGEVMAASDKRRNRAWRKVQAWGELQDAFMRSLVAPA